MRILVFIIAFAFTLFNLLYGQTDTLDRGEEVREMAEVTTVGIATGLHINKYPMIEVGYFKHTTFEFPMTFGGSYTVETYFIEDLIIAPKLNYWVNVLFINAGISVPWYFNFQGENSVKIRPEIGFGFKNFKINYAINVSLTNKNMAYIGKNFLSLNYYFGLKEK